MTHAAPKPRTAYGSSASADVATMLHTISPGAVRTYVPSQDAAVDQLAPSTPHTMSRPILKLDHPRGSAEYAASLHAYLGAAEAMADIPGQQTGPDHEYNIHPGADPAAWQTMWAADVLPGLHEINTGRTNKLLSVPIISAYQAVHSGQLPVWTVAGADRFGVDCYDPHLVPALLGWVARIGSDWVLAEYGATVHAWPSSWTWQQIDAALVRAMHNFVAAAVGHGHDPVRMMWFDGNYNVLSATHTPNALAALHTLCTTGHLPA